MVVKLWHFRNLTNFVRLFSATPLFFARNSARTLLNPKQKKSHRWILMASGIIALADVIGLSSMTPVLMLAIDKSFLEKSRKLRYLYQLGDFSSEAHFLIALIVFIFLFFLLKNIAGLALYRYTRKFAIEVAEDLSRRNFNQTFEENALKEDTLQTDLYDRVVFNPHYYVTGILLPYINLISELIVVAALTLIFTIYKPGLVLLIAGLLGTAFYAVNRYTRNKISTLGKEGASFRDKVLGVLNLGFSGLVDIKSYKAGDYFRRKYGEFYQGYLKSTVKAVSYQLIPSRINELVALIGIIILVVYGYFISSNVAEVRVMAALFVIAVFRLLPAANRLLQSVMHIKMYQYTVERLVPWNASTSSASSSFSSAEAGSAGPMQDIQICNIDFSYPNGAQVFENAQLTIPSGSTTGICGKSGVGKSTLIKLLLGLAKPDGGEIKLGNHSVKNGELVHPCSLVTQEPYLVPGTVLENVAFGISAENIDSQKACQALRKAAFSLDAPEDQWLSHPVLENGNNLSGGQKQRLSLARAFYKDQQWLVLDEPTSALDKETEDLVIHTLKEWKSLGKTILIIAHRERILELCDQVFEIRDKQIHPLLLT